MKAEPARILRPYAENCRNRPPPSQRDRDRRAYILEAAEAMFVQFGRAAVTMPQFSSATGLSPVTIRRHIADLDHLFGLILARHLDSIRAAISEIPDDDPDHVTKRRAEYFRMTRGALGVPTPMHFLLLRDRFCLPPDEREPLESQHRIIGELVGGGGFDDVLMLLDSPNLDLEKIEAGCALFANIDRARQERHPPHAEPAPTPADPPPEIPDAVRTLAPPPNHLEPPSLETPSLETPSLETPSLGPPKRLAFISRPPRYPPERPP